MKKLNIVFNLMFSFVLSAAFLSCGTTNVTPPAQQEPKTAEVVEEAPAEPPVVQETTPEPIAEVTEEPAVVSEVDDEYSRSVGDVQVSRDTFIDDKEKVLQIIKELDTIMKNMNYNAWLPYVEPASIDYWKLRKNLQKYETRLPIKGIKLRDLQDYFKHVFVPSRKGKEVTEIRYISDTYIKAVQVREKQGDLIYYYFNKINGKWMVHLPTNEEMN